jgi:hypothetical protein
VAEDIAQRLVEMLRGIRAPDIVRMQRKTHDTPVFRTFSVEGVELVLDHLQEVIRLAVPGQHARVIGLAGIGDVDEFLAAPYIDRPGLIIVRRQVEMHEAWVRAAELVMRLPQEHRRVPATHVVEPEDRSKNLPGAVLVIGFSAVAARRTVTINLEFWQLNYQFTGEINFSSLTSVLDRMVY